MSPIPQTSFLDGTFLSLLTATELYFLENLDLKILIWSQKDVESGWNTKFICISYILLPVYNLGDPKQLGPVLRSPIALKYGLQISLLERLMNTSEVYKRCEKTKDYPSKAISKLLNNFRR